MIMMKDITKDIVEASEEDILWQFYEFNDYLESIKNEGNRISFDECEDNWANIFKDSVGVAVVWRRYPLIFVLSSEISFFKKPNVNFHYIRFVEVESFTKRCLKIESKISIEYLSELIDFNGFSVDDDLFNSNKLS